MWVIIMIAYGRKKEQLSILTKALRKMNTYQGITTMIATWLRSFDETVDTSEISTPTYTDILLVKAI